MLALKVEKWPPVKEFGWFLRTGKDQRNELFLELPERSNPADSLILT